MTTDNQFWINTLGFTWDRNRIPTPTISSVERAVWRFGKKLPQFVWDSAKLEGNPFTFPQVQTLMDGITVGGHKVSDEKQVQGLIDSSRLLIRLVEDHQFQLNETVSRQLHWALAKDEALDAGNFRGQGQITDATPNVHLGQLGTYTPPPTTPGGANLEELNDNAIHAITTRLDNPLEQALIYNLFGCLTQLYFDGNKRTSRLMMNGHLLANGIDGISIPASWRDAYNTAMVQFYYTRQTDHP